MHADEPRIPCSVRRAKIEKCEHLVGAQWMKFAGAHQEPFEKNRILESSGNRRPFRIQIKRDRAFFMRRPAWKCPPPFAAASAGIFPVFENLHKNRRPAGNRFRDAKSHLAVGSCRDAFDFDVRVIAGEDFREAEVPQQKKRAGSETNFQRRSQPFCAG